jgi:hypothetical protein
MVGSIPGDNEPISWGVFPLMGDHALYVRWNGGGGIGDALDRPPEKVTADLVAGLISKEAAGEVYGVVESKGIVDHRATEAKRKGLASGPACCGTSAMEKRISENLFAENGKICCASCAHALAPSGISGKRPPHFRPFR